jgi:predicted ribosomally synthesized peptide with nif11-like leader
MSKAQLERFISVVSSDPTVLEQASDCEEDLQKCARNVVQYAKAQGYDFTEDEAREWLAERARELEDSQLDTIAGGAGHITVPKAGDAVTRATPTLGSYDLKLGSKIESHH